MAPTNTLSEEKVQDSSDEDFSRSPETRPGPKGRSGRSEKTSKTKASAIESSMNENSSDESDVSESSSQSSVSSVSAGSKRKAVESDKTTSKSPAKKFKTSLTHAKRVESAAYVPPQGYTTNKMQSSEVSSQAQGIFKNLNGKQIWHISAPASFPISKLESLNVQTALNGEPLLQHKGISYTLSQGNPSETALLTPKPNGDYAHAANVSHIFNITGKSDTTTRLENGAVENPESSQSAHRDDSTVAPSTVDMFFATHTGQKKAPRKQPDNLRARYVPYGVINEVTDANEVAQDGDTSMADASPEPVASTQAHSQVTPKSIKKSKTKTVQSPEVTVEETPLKRKKEKTATSSSQAEPSENDSSQRKRKEKSKK